MSQQDLGNLLGLLCPRSELTLGEDCHPLASPKLRSCRIFNPTEGLLFWVNIIPGHLNSFTDLNFLDAEEVSFCKMRMTIAALSTFMEL